MPLSKPVTRAWLPAIFATMIVAGLWHSAPFYWLFGVPPSVLVVFMVSLAEVHDRGTHIEIERLGFRRQVPREEILSSKASFIEGINVIRLRHYVLPWGCIFFVYDWSKPIYESRRSSIGFAASAAAVFSGFLAGRFLKLHLPEDHIAFARLVGAGAALLLMVLFVAVRRKSVAVSNGMLFLAAGVAGLLSNIWR